jgi:hypothetical protein
MKLCTRLKILAVDADGSMITECQLVDISFVEDDHEFGLHEGMELHIEGHTENVGTKGNM